MSLDAYIAARIGIVGYGPVVGAALANTVADAVASLPEGHQAAAGIACGTLIPVVPITVAMMMKSPLNKGPATPILAGFCGILVAGCFATTYYNTLTAPLVDDVVEG
eukprot:CAMPEP_0168529194 /NCGR_PEP_ID=MMETSP0405-20121227/13747_1 /TAXON_ID=498012 /ORGANISM="Trichosphaerium sp, Strain Am-I-7 wt" /LENGTH=106 /DNA_ID=CAMNT_0008552839 /DNA_START=87 /DNA_END=407 /DNA_ORIENTATION=+